MLMKVSYVCLQANLILWFEEMYLLIKIAVVVLRRFE
jgi:hypothetical protein